jgi:hypothetical protein
MVNSIQVILLFVTFNKLYYLAVTPGYPSGVAQSQKDKIRNGKPVVIPVCPGISLLMATSTLALGPTSYSKGALSPVIKPPKLTANN